MPWLTVQQNLALVDKTASGERLAGLLEQVGLKDCAQLYPKQLSGGMQRRVALLRAGMGRWLAPAACVIGPMPTVP